jgi:hypothetical protein
MSYFSSVAGGSIVFSYDFLVSLVPKALGIGSFLGIAKKNESLNSTRP